VNNAGVYTLSPTDSFSEEEFHREFNINVLGVLLSIREALKHFATKAAASSTLVRSSAASHTQGAIYVVTKSAVDGAR
jgi:3-oxoacyl-[acyl-carrier protein] reductase